MRSAAAGSTAIAISRPSRPAERGESNARGELGEERAGGGRERRQRATDQVRDPDEVAGRDGAHHERDERSDDHRVRADERRRAVAELPPDRLALVRLVDRTLFLEDPLRGREPPWEAEPGRWETFHPHAAARSYASSNRRPSARKANRRTPSANDSGNTHRSDSKP